jgi:hypothetical protein
MDILAASGILGTFAFGALTVYFYFRPRKVQQLTATAKQYTLGPLLWPEYINFESVSELSGDVLRRLSRFVVVLRNTGAQEIRAADLDGGHLSITGHNCKLFHVELVAAQPSEVRADCQMTSYNEARLHFDYLNQGDAFAVSVIFLGDGLGLHGRVKGGKLKVTSFRRAWRYRVLSAIMHIILMGVVIAAAIPAAAAVGDLLSIHPLNIFFGLAFALVMLAAVTSSWCKRQLDQLLYRFERTALEVRVLSSMASEERKFWR